MIPVGYTGDIGSGKSTLAEYTAENASNPGHWESSGIITEIANRLRQQPLYAKSDSDYRAYTQWLSHLPEYVLETTHISIDTELSVVTAKKVTRESEAYAKLFAYGQRMRDRPELNDGPITAENKDDLRSILQWLGGFLAKQVSGDIWYNEIIRRAYAAGVDFASIGGVRFPADAAVIRANGGYIFKVIRPQQAAQDTTDITERERDQISADSIIYNDGSLEDLRRCAAEIYRDLVAQRVKPEYRASDID